MREGEREGGRGGDSEAKRMLSQGACVRECVCVQRRSHSERERETECSQQQQQVHG